MVNKEQRSLFINNIVESLMPINPEKIILFGSYAYGTPTEDSDLDICVVKKAVTKRYEEMGRVRELLKDIPIEKDIIVESSQFLVEHSGEEWINTVWYDLVHDGILLYEKK